MRHLALCPQHPRDHSTDKYRRHCVPGYGYIEQIEIDYEPRCDDGTLAADSDISLWWRHLSQATHTMGKPIAYRHDTRQLLERAGFTDVSEQIIKMPLNRWPTDPWQRAIGECYSILLGAVDPPIDAISGMSMAPFSRVFNWQRGVIEDFAKRVTHLMLKNEVHVYSNMYVLLARVLMPILGRNG